MSADSSMQALGMGDVLGRRRRALPLLAMVAAGLLAAVGVGAWVNGERPAVPQFHTQAATRAPLIATVSATGTLQPVKQVDIGSELSGTIALVAVEENDRITRGQLLAQLDVSRLQDQSERSRAAVSAAQAQVKQAQAGVQEAELTLRRVRKLLEWQPQPFASQAELDSAQATQTRAEGALAAAEAAVGQAQATLRSDLTNLDKAHIR